MAYASGAAAAAAAAAAHSSSYRLKFQKKEFLELVDIAKPDIIYKRGKNHIFAFDGFVMYSQECEDEDLVVKHAHVIETIEFSNSTWQT
jgi:hypothetical protein